jgi:hypothetical protein
MSSIQSLKFSKARLLQPVPGSFIPLSIKVPQIDIKLFVLS